jgi:hypothetical protein
MTSFGANPVETVLGGDVALLDAVVEGFYGAGDAQRVRFNVDCARCGSRESVESSMGTNDRRRRPTADDGWGRDDRFRTRDAGKRMMRRPGNPGW